MNAAEITDKLGLHSLRQRAWYIQAACATSGDGLYEGLEWVSRTVSAHHHAVLTPPPALCQPEEAQPVIVLSLCMHSPSCAPPFLIFSYLRWLRNETCFIPASSSSANWRGFEAFPPGSSGR
jgi:hypothetical protein